MAIVKAGFMDLDVFTSVTVCQVQKIFKSINIKYNSSKIYI